MATIWMPGLKAVFIHVPKTAGKSISTALGEYRHIWTDKDRIRWADLLANDVLSRRLYRYGHARAIDMRRFIGEKAWKKAFTFAMIRDPIQHTLSGYRYALKTQQLNMSLDDWLESVEANRIEHLAYSQWPLVLDEKNHIMVDYLGNFDRLDACFKTICMKLGIGKKDLPHTNKTNGPTRITWSQETRIRDMFYLDYNHFSQTLQV
jgi:hypothetical protein